MWWKEEIIFFYNLAVDGFKPDLRDRENRRKDVSK